MGVGKEEKKGIEVNKGHYSGSYHCGHLELTHTGDSQKSNKLPLELSQTKSKENLSVKSTNFLAIIDINPLAFLVCPWTAS